MQHKCRLGCQVRFELQQRKLKLNKPPKNENLLETLFEEKDIYLGEDGHEFGEVYHVAALLLAIGPSWPKHTRIVLSSEGYGPAQACFLRSVCATAGVEDDRILEGGPLEEGQYFPPCWLSWLLLVRSRNKEKETLQKVTKGFRSLAKQVNSDGVSDLLEKRILGSAPRGRVLVWIRKNEANSQAFRNVDKRDLATLISVVMRAGYQPIVIGERIEITEGIEDVIDLRGIWGDELFSAKGPNRDTAIQAQLYLIHLLMKKYGVRAALGIKSGGMDGGTFLGLPTMSICRAKRSLEKRMVSLATLSAKFQPLFLVEKKAAAREGKEKELGDHGHNESVGQKRSIAEEEEEQKWDLSMLTEEILCGFNTGMEDAYC